MAVQKLIKFFHVGLELFHKLCTGAPLRSEVVLGLF